MYALGRVARVLISDRLLEYPSLEMEFEVNFSVDSDGNTGQITLYNLNSGTVELFKKGQLLTLSAGYKGDVGIIFPGSIVSAKTNWERPDKVTEVIIGDHTDKWLTATINQSWKAGIKASQIVNDLSSVLSLGAGKIEIKNDVTYSRGKHFAGTCKAALEELARDLKLKLHISRGKVYLIAKETGSTETVVLSSNTGLIGEPEKMDESQKVNGVTAPSTGDRWKVQTLLNYRLQTDSVVKIESKKITGLFRVEKGKHILNADDFETELEVVKNGT